MFTIFISISSPISDKLALEIFDFFLSSYIIKFNYYKMLKFFFVNSVSPRLLKIKEIPCDIELFLLLSVNNFFSRTLLLIKTSSLTHSQKHTRVDLLQFQHISTPLYLQLNIAKADETHQWIETFFFVLYYIIFLFA